MISVEKGRTEKKNAQSDQVDLKKKVWMYDKQYVNECGTIVVETAKLEI